MLLPFVTTDITDVPKTQRRRSRQKARRKQRRKSPGFGQVGLGFGLGFGLQGLLRFKNFGMRFGVFG